MKQSNDKLTKKNFLHQFYKGNKIAFSAVVFSTLFVGVLGLAVSWLLQQLIDTISGTANALELKTLGLITVSILLLLVIMSVMEYISKPYFMKKAMQQYKEYAFQNLMKKSIHTFQKETTATYISALTNDVNSIEVNYLSNQFRLISAFVSFCGAFIMMVWYSPLLTLIVVLLTVLPLVASLLAGNRMETAELSVSGQNAFFTDTIKESISGFSVIKSFKAEKPVLALFKKRNEETEQEKYKRNRISIMIVSISGIAGFIAQVGVFIAGAYLAMSGNNITPGVVLVFVNLMNYILQPISVIPEILANRKAALALIDKLCGCLNENCREDKAAEIKKLEHKIEIQNMSFAYKEEEDVLKNINLTFESGKSYALVGTSGSGKSTILNLLLASYDNYKGKILYDGQELRDISSESLYDVVSVIQQNVVIFNASVRDNITMFASAAKEEVDRIIEMSGLLPFIKEHGEDYLCGENGNALSGGEKQRIAIARSLLRKSSVLLSDEATAALDKQTAHQVFNSILGIEDLTRIVVTHSLDSELLKRFDEVIVLKDGKVIEKGIFEELMKKKEYFYSLYTVVQ